MHNKTENCKLKTENYKILYIEAPDGISGDMVLGALIDLGIGVEKITLELEKLIPGKFALIPNEYERNGIHGINLDVVTDAHCNGHDHSHAHSHRHYKDIRNMISASGIPEKAKHMALDIFHAIAEAEAAVHRVDIGEVAFHEVGALDSIIDIVGTAIAVDLLGTIDIYCSAPHDGSGSVECRHGLIPVPVPAVFEMAKDFGIPIIIDSDVNTEMITPTGFGILRGLHAKFEPRLGIVPEKTGYGFGKRETGRLGAVRVTLGEKYMEAEEDNKNNRKKTETKK